MPLNASNEWDGICACGRASMDGVRCRLGATHEPRKPMPWEKPKEPAKEFPW